MAPKVSDWEIDRKGARVDSPLGRGKGRQALG